MAIKKDLGAVTAYAIAVEQGYQGSEEEWAISQAEAGNNANKAKAEADRAKQEANRAKAEASKLNIHPDEKTDLMTNPVGVDENGKLWGKTDPTLTLDGVAADAGAVGKALDDKQDKEGEWELIETIDITGQETRYDRTEKPDGTPYNFKKMMILLLCESPKGEFQVNMYFHSGDFTNNIVCTTNPLVYTESHDFYMRSTYENKNGAGFAETTFGSRLSNTVIQNAGDAPATNMKNVTRARLLIIRNTFAPGGKIEIWGVKA